jgi:hypothetical protein
MLIDEEVYLAYEAEDFLDHHGVKGQKWGIRNKASRAVKATGRGIKKVGKTAKKHPLAVRNVVAATIVAGILATHGANRFHDTSIANMRQAEHMRKLRIAGSAWRYKNGPWHYAVPSKAAFMAPETVKALTSGGR